MVNKQICNLSIHTYNVVDSHITFTATMWAVYFTNSKKKIINHWTSQQTSKFKAFIGFFCGYLLIYAKHLELLLTYIHVSVTDQYQMLLQRQVHRKMSHTFDKLAGSCYILKRFVNQCCRFHVILLNLQTCVLRLSFCCRTNDYQDCKHAFDQFIRKVIIPAV